MISARTRSFNRPLQGTVDAYETFIGGKAARSALAALAHLPTQPCTEHRRDGTVRVPTIGFDLLYVLAIIRLGRRQLVWIKVTPNPTAEGIAPQITEAFPWNEAPRYLIGDRDWAYGAAVTRRLRTMGIRDTAPGSPWQIGFAGKVDRINPARVRGPHRRAGRGALVHAR